jgi:4-hydroxy-tetrahydrodipicolinate reductase
LNGKNVKIALIGYGKMGKAIEEIAVQKNHHVVLKVDEHNADSFTATELSMADVAIEFTRPEAGFKNIVKCFDANVPVVCGTTGWADKLEEIKKICRQKNQSFFYASNFSVGVNIFFEVNKKLAELMNRNAQYDEIFINEIHHLQKLDAPSGTALSLAEQILEKVNRLKSWRNYASGENKPPLKKDEELPVFSSREGEAPGTHMVKYISHEDEIEIIHKAFSRKGFAKGALSAAEWIIGKKGVFGMKDLLNL